MWTAHPAVRRIVAFVREFQDTHDNINPKGMASEDSGDIGQYVYGELILAPAFTGAWEQLQDANFASRVEQFVLAESARLNRRNNSRRHRPS